VNPRDITESVLAVIVVGGVVAIHAYGAFTGKPVVVAPELYGFGGIIVGAYFRGQSVNGAIGKLTAALQQSVPMPVTIASGSTVSSSPPTVTIGSPPQ
jgi:hypothetical protein